MGNLFSRKKVSRVTEHDKAVLQVKQQRDKIKQYQARIEKKLEEERLMAKELLNNGKKEKAKLLLRKKRYQEQLLARTDGQLENLEKLIHELEYSQIELEVVKGLKVGNEALNKVNELLNIDEIERILEETQEGIEKQKEINDLLSGQLTTEDEAAVEEEYEKMIEKEMMEQKEKEILQLPDVPSELPEIPAAGKEKVDKTKGRIALEAT